MKNQSDEQYGGNSEGTPLLQHQQEQLQQETEPIYPQPVGPGQLPSNMNGANPNSMAALATLAAQYEQAGYTPSDAAAAAASMAAYQQQQQQLYAVASAFGYPPQTQAQMYHPSQTQQYFQTSSNKSPSSGVIASSLSSQGVPSASRPPRSSRRASSPVLPETGNGSNSNSLPPLQDIFSHSNTDSTTNNNGPDVNSNYGSIAQLNSPIWSAPTHSTSPNTNYISGGAKRVAAVLIRTSSSGAIGRQTNSPKQAGQRGHRRSSSDLPINRHRRTGSGESPALPSFSGGSGHRRSGSFGGGNGTGSSMISGSDRPRTLSSGSLSRPRRGSGHRRSGSVGSVGTNLTNLSSASIRSNIAKSSMFGGFDPYTGQVQMHFPFEAVRLVFVDEHSNLSGGEKLSKQQPPVDPHAMLTQGHLYMEGWSSDFEDFEDYTNITNAMEEGMTPQWETLDRVPMNDGNNLDINSIIKPPSYLLPVSAKVYKRMVGEISDAHYMPCGLFFCGHHEDVSHPSIAIAIAIVIMLFGFMAYVAFFIEGS